MKDYIEKNYLKFREVNEKLELTEGELAQTNEKLKATYSELTNTKAKIKSIETHPTTTEDKSKFTDADLKTTFSQLEPNVMNRRQYSKNSDQTETEHKSAISNVTNAIHLFHSKGTFDAGERKIIRSQTGAIYSNSNSLLLLNLLGKQFIQTFYPHLFARYCVVGMNRLFNKQ